MLNENTLNENTLGTGSTPVSATLDDIAINSFGLQNANITVSKITDDVETKVSSFDRPQINGRGFLSNFKRGRNITMDVVIRGDTEEDFLTNLDNFRKEIYTEESLLSWKRPDGEYRKIKVNCVSNPKIFNHYNITFLTMRITFRSLEPFWYKESYQSKNITGKTANFSEEISNLGKAVSDVKVYIIFNTATVSVAKLKIGDEEITITETITDGDIIYINGEEKTVELNGVEIDYDGIFPSMNAGTNFFTYTITGTFSLDTIILNRKNYV